MEVVSRVPITINSGCDYSIIRNLRFDGNLNIASNGCFIHESFQSTGNTITDSGTANHLQVIQE